MKNIAIITGATGGLGREFVRQLIEEVDEVWAVGRNIEKLNSLEKIYGEKIKSFSIDLSDISNLEKIRSELESRDYMAKYAHIQGGQQPNDHPYRDGKAIMVKYLVNNAGSGRMAPSTDFTADEMQSHINTHNTSMAVLCNICIPYMEKGCHIINVASQSAFQPVAYINLYAASKAFCCSYSRALNLELQEKGIVVTAACPGWIKTELLQTEINGQKVHFPHLAEPEEVVKKAIKDAKKGKDMSVYSAYVRRMQFFSKYYPHKWIMHIWLKSIRKYIQQI